MDLKYSTTSRVQRTETSNFVFSDFVGTVIARSSAMVGILMAGRFTVLDIVLHLSTIGAAEADDCAHIAAIHKCRLVEDSSDLSAKWQCQEIAPFSFIFVRADLTCG